MEQIRHAQSSKDSVFHAYAYFVRENKASFSDTPWLRRSLSSAPITTNCWSNLALFGVRLSAS